MATGQAKPRAPSPLRSGVTVAYEQENRPIRKQEEERPALYRPKSKLRLRLKLTPPHPINNEQRQTPPTPSLKAKILSSTTRTNEPAVRKSTHQQQTSMSTIRAHTPTRGQAQKSTQSEGFDSHTSSITTTGINHFPTRFESGSPDLDSEDERHRRAADQQMEREKRTKGWFPPTKAIPRSRSAWNLRTAEGKASKSRETLEDQGSECFESDFDGRSFETRLDTREGNALSSKRSLRVSHLSVDSPTTASGNGGKQVKESETLSTHASSTLVPEVESNHYLKSALASPRASFSSHEIHDSAGDQVLCRGTPQPYDALAMITAEHPNYSTSTVNLTLTVSDHSSVYSANPGPPSSAGLHESRPSDESVRQDGEWKQLSPASTTSSSPFTLDKPTKGDRSGDWVDTSTSSAGQSRPKQAIALVTPTKSNGIGQPLRSGTSRIGLQNKEESKRDTLSPYTDGLNPISKDAVDAWSPSKAFAYTDRKTALHSTAVNFETSHTNAEEVEEVLNDSFKTKLSRDTSTVANHSPANQRDSSSDRVPPESVCDGDADTSLDSAYTASFTGAAYTTPPKIGRIKTSQARRKERDAKEVSNDIFSLSDQMLSDRYKFVQEIGFGNWGSVWQCKPRTPAAHPLHRSTVSRNQPSLFHAVASQHHPTKVAIKLVHRSKQATTAARVRALWSEMKIVRTLKLHPHPNIIGFDSFIITPSYALIIMPFLAQLMPVSISEERAKGYFLQLTSALAYLHENGVTHNDIKPSNIMLSSTNTPIFVDFGFAQKWDVNAVHTGASTLIGGLTTLTGHSASCHELFQSEISWGTPEYLDPQRAKGLRHDERASDVWALGVTFFEILVGRTPFEESEDEQFSTAEQLSVYYDRTVKGEWLGDWSMSSAMKGLLESMIRPDPRERINARDANQHTALDYELQVDLSTPPFVRTAASLPIEPRAKKQLPREKREQKRSQALQAETGAKFVAFSHVVEPLPTQQAETEDTKVLPEKETGFASTNHEVSGERRARMTTTRSRPGDCTPSDPARADVNLSACKVSPKIVAQSSSARDTASSHASGTDSRADPELDHQRADEDVSPSIRQGEQRRDLRRTASADALRSKGNILDDIARSGEEQLKLSQAINRPASTAATHQFRHARIASEGAMRTLDHASYNAAGERTRPKSQLSLVDKRKVDQEIDDVQEKAVRFESGESCTPRSALSPVTQIKVELAHLRNGPTEADLDAKLDRLALWVEDVEQIVEEAKYALRAVQAERPPSRQLLRRLEMEQDGQAEYRRSPHIARPPSAAGNRIPEIRRPSSSMHLRYGSSYEFAPVVHADGFKPTHLRRQRSDLTDFRGRTSSAIEELRRREYESRGYDEWPETRARVEFAKKLRTYRSTGDLHRGTDSRPTDPQRMTEALKGKIRSSEGWYRYEARPAYSGHEYRRGRPQESRLKSMFHSMKAIFKRRE
ncbi:hypothetical protein NliqN6_2905 [Naganishia liquefaciens]|uniref:Protein kinase domain-containing protein n=1 Tax=Naganishia liquefaciens TaxID=104408 RepID=A0A8H3TSV6_9TREE|nr:hypothetical protein NliqN6_2905 [Naganishia liquefaciens]